jgi:hypothetical protein
MRLPFWVRSAIVSRRAISATLVLCQRDVFTLLFRKMIGGKMRPAILKTVGLTIVIGFCLAFPAFGAPPPTVDFGITSAEGNNLAGVYTDPYNGCVGCSPGNAGTLVQAFCDDFVDDVNPPQYWTAFANDLNQFTSSATVSTVYYSGASAASQTTRYIAIAILAGESLATSVATTKNELSFALWGVFDPTLLNSDCNQYGCLDSSPNNPNLAAANTYLSDAMTAAQSYVSGADYEAKNNVTVKVFTAEANGSVDSPNSGRPQEFVTVAMPEPSSLAALIFDFLFAGIAVLLFRRRESRNRT